MIKPLKSGLENFILKNNYVILPCWKIGKDLHPSVQFINYIFDHLKKSILPHVRLDNSGVKAKSQLYYYNLLYIAS